MRKLHPDRYDIWAGVIILSATLLRYLLIAQGWPAAYNDEGTLGLMALHIAYQGAHPLLYYGQNYLGSLEAYIGAGLFHLLGPSTFALRLGLLPLFALFLICMYLLAALLYTKSLALISLIVLALGSPDIFLRQLMAAGGTPEMLFFTALLLLLTAWLILTSRGPENESKGHPGEGGITPPAGKNTRRLPWTRLAAYAAWGVVAGFDLWSHLLCLPFVLCAGALLLFFCRQELRLPALAMLLAALLLGLSPLIIYNITTPVTSNELSLFTGAFGGGYREPSYPVPQSTRSATNTKQRIVSAVAPEPITPRPVLQVGGTLLVGIPVITNGIALCPLDTQQAWPLTGRPGVYIISCSVVHGAWGIMLISLWCAAIITAWRRFWRAWRYDPPESRINDRQREAKRQAARIIILIGAGSTILAFMLYPQASSVSPWISARYLIGLLIATPALLAPLWEGATALATSRSWPALLGLLAARSLLLIIIASSLLGTISTFTGQITAAHAGDQIQKDLIARLEQLQANDIYTDYEDCSRLAFLSNERIVCAVLDNGLQPGLDRYFPYRAIVARASHPFYVFRQGSPQSILFEQAAAAQHIPYTRSLLDGYIIYDPASRVAT